ncbi:BTB/POZ domain-containing protein [Criblamydia sequanensis]|uniref:BTB domain-containing protein n=1 Tax=Candidatus Criblamydia sequanensis CRIB-18 TaxID=1437425 RepID=A0A090CZZ0_9BACT|nr:BTB/POZ domain-containing protein [Criblamydia sequanensis]CDR33115.1 hypothetical protein CSEC_0276 [Criblamydia sequanensis CRIB-18]
MSFGLIKAGVKIAEAYDYNFRSYFDTRSYVSHSEQGSLQYSLSEKKRKRENGNCGDGKEKRIRCLAKVLRGEELTLGEFFSTLRKIKKIEDLYGKISEEEKDLKLFQAALKVIQKKITLLKIQDELSFDLEISDFETTQGVKGSEILLIHNKKKIKRNCKTLEAVKRVGHFCKTLLAVKKGGFSFIHQQYLGSDVRIYQSLNDSTLTENELLLLLDSLSKENKDKFNFFDFSKYPNLTLNAPSLVKMKLANLSNSCFGNLPDSLCDVVLVPVQEADLSLSIDDDSSEELVIEEKSVEVSGPEILKGKEKVLTEDSPICQEDEAPDESHLEKNPVEGGAYNLKTNKEFLATESGYFKQLFFSGMKETHEKCILLRGIDPLVFKTCFDIFFLRANLENASLTHLVEVAKLAHFFDLASVITFIHSQIAIRLNDYPVTNDTVGLVCRTYVEMESTFLREEENQSREAMIRFFKKVIVESDERSLRDIFVSFIANDMPILELLKILKEEFFSQGKGKKEKKAFINIYNSLLEASFISKGKFLKEIVDHFSDGCAFFLTPSESLGKYIQILKKSFSRKVSLEVRTSIFMKLLSLAGKAEKNANILSGKWTGLKKKGIDRTKSFLKILEGMLKDYGAEGIPDSDTYFEDKPFQFLSFAHLIMQYANLAETLNWPGKKIAYQLSCIANCIYKDQTSVEENPIVYASYIKKKLYQNLSWGKTCSWPLYLKDETEIPGMGGVPSYVVFLLEELNPLLSDSSNIFDFLHTESQDPLVQSLSALVHYHGFQDTFSWDAIFSKSSYVLSINPKDDLALSLYGASLYQISLAPSLESSEKLKEDAKKVLNEALLLNQKNSIALLYLARLSLGRDNRAAIDYFKKIEFLEISERTAPLIKLLIEEGSEEEVNELYEKIGKRKRTLEKGLSIDPNIELMWLGFFGALSLRKQDPLLLLHARNLIEESFSKDKYNFEILTLLKNIYSLDVTGPVSLEKKVNLRETMALLVEKEAAKKTEKPAQRIESSEVDSNQVIELPQVVASHVSEADSTQQVGTSGSETSNTSSSSSSTFELEGFQDVNEFFELSQEELLMEEFLNI